MKSRKYPSYDEAIADLESKGKLVYGGHEGLKMVYSLDIVGHIDIFYLYMRMV